MNSTKQTVLMFVGPDMCGKTNISQELSRRLQVPYFKPSEEKLTFLNNQEKFILDTRYADTRMADFLKQTNHSVIFDRGYPCEWVYSRFFNRKTDDDALKHVDEIHSQIGTKVIIPFRLSYDNITDDLDPSIKGDKLIKLEKLYREFSKWTKLKCMFLNVDSKSIDEEISEIMKFIEVNV